MRLSRTAYCTMACALLLIAGGLYYFNREEVPPPPRQVEAKAEPSLVTFAGSSIFEQQDGKKNWEITAETVQVSPDTNKAQLINFKATIYRPDGSKIDIVGRQAELDTKTRDIDMSGDIRATSSSDGAVFTAPRGRWNGSERRFYGSDGITLTRGDTVITGDKIESDERFEKVKVTGNARVLKGGTSP